MLLQPHQPLCCFEDTHQGRAPPQGFVLVALWKCPPQPRASSQHLPSPAVILLLAGFVLSLS